MYITCTVLSVLVVHLAVATDDAEKRDVKLLPPKFVADKYGVNVGDKVNAETAEKISKEALELGERTPFFAAAGNDELLMLPEVFSKLNPEDVQRDFAQAGDSAGEQSLRDTRW